MKIGAREVGPAASVLIIAEIGSNHGGSLDRALALIDAAADAGADCAKFQYFRVDRFLVPRETPESLRPYELPDDWLPVLKARCTEKGIEFLCTAFDLESLDVVDPFVDAHKIGSYEAVNGGYDKAVEKKGKPIIVSMGAIGNLGDFRHGFRQDTVFLLCTSQYPAPIDGYFAHWDRLSVAWGVSDHTLHPTIVPAAAVALGACVVEKHLRPFHSLTERAGTPYGERPKREYMPDNSDTPDWSVSIGPGDFRTMVEAVRLTEKAVRG